MHFCAGARVGIRANFLDFLNFGKSRFPKKSLSDTVGIFQKISQPGLFFVYFHLFKQTLQFLQQIHVKNVIAVYGAGIRTHNLQDFNLLPELLVDQGSRPTVGILNSIPNNFPPTFSAADTTTADLYPLTDPFTRLANPMEASSVLRDRQSTFPRELNSRKK